MFLNFSTLFTMRRYICAMIFLLNVDRLLTASADRRGIFGRDDRRTIRHSRRMPYESVVQLSTGCTGTLIWYQHVLTAAHCVHDHWQYFKDVKVGISRRHYGTTEWVDVVEMNVPTVWKRQNAVKYLKNDYAVVKLSHPHGRRYVSFGVGRIIDRRIKLVGFTDEQFQRRRLVSSECHVASASKHLTESRCDATKGMSGSGVFLNGHDRTLTGVFSSYVEMGGGYASNIAVRLTPKKVRRICTWMNAGRACQLLNKPAMTSLTRFVIEM